jgi:hypothetical protein
MLQTHGTSASFTNVIRECPDLATRMDMGIRTPQCFYLSKRRGGGTRKCKTIYCFSRQVPFYYNDHHGSIYLGRLNFNDEEFCGQIFELLKANCGRSITEIGSIDIPDAPDLASG